MADWSRIVNTTIANYIKGEEVNILRNRKITAMLKSRGRITMNWSGDHMDWKIRYRRAPMQGYADTDTLTFPRRDRWKTATLPWRGYAITDSMTKGEKLKNRSVQAIINIYDQIARSILEDMEEAFGDEFYIDGNAAGNQKRIHGIESMFSSVTQSAGNFVGLPGNTFAGLSCALGAYGGSWTTGTWPSGKGDAHYDFWSPLIVDYTNSGWTAQTKTWANTCIEALRFAFLKSQKNKTTKGKLDVCFLESELYRGFLGQLDARQRLLIQSNESNSTLIKLGFTDVQNFDGVDVTYEYGTPNAVGYGMNVDQMELRSMQGQMFVPEGPDYDIAGKSWRFSVDFFGNCVWNPRYQLKLAAIS
jgi:hypothetical protein